MSEPDPQPSSGPAGPANRLRLRRAPRYRAFTGSGAVAGVLVAVLATQLAANQHDGQGRAVLGYLAVSLGLLGALAGAGLALLAERRHRDDR